jgi:hypothetical protein
VSYHVHMPLPTFGLSSPAKPNLARLLLWTSPSPRGPCSPIRTLSSTARAPCIDYPTQQQQHSTTSKVVVQHRLHKSLCPTAHHPAEQFWLAHCPRLSTRVTPTTVTLTTSKPPSWRGFTFSGLATPALSSDQVGSSAEATSSNHLNWPEY